MIVYGSEHQWADTPGVGVAVLGGATGYQQHPLPPPSLASTPGIITQLGSPTAFMAPPIMPLKADADYPLYPDSPSPSPPPLRPPPLSAPWPKYPKSIHIVEDDMYPGTMGEIVVFEGSESTYSTGSHHKKKNKHRHKKHKHKHKHHHHRGDASKRSRSVPVQRPYGVEWEYARDGDGNSSASSGAGHRWEWDRGEEEPFRRGNSGAYRSHSMVASTDMMRDHASRANRHPSYPLTGPEGGALHRPPPHPHRGQLVPYGGPSGQPQPTIAQQQQQQQHQQQPQQQQQPRIAPYPIQSPLRQGPQGQGRPPVISTPPPMPYPVHRQYTPSPQQQQQEQVTNRHNASPVFPYLMGGRGNTTPQRQPQPLQHPSPSSHPQGEILHTHVPAHTQQPPVNPNLPQSTTYAPMQGTGAGLPVGSAPRMGHSSASSLLPMDSGATVPAQLTSGGPPKKDGMTPPAMPIGTPPTPNNQIVSPHVLHPNPHQAEREQHNKQMIFQLREEIESMKEEMDNRDHKAEAFEQLKDEIHKLQHYKVLQEQEESKRDVELYKKEAEIQVLRNKLDAAHSKLDSLRKIHLPPKPETLRESPLSIPLRPDSPQSTSYHMAPAVNAQFQHIPPTAGPPSNNSSHNPYYTPIPQYYRQQISPATTEAVNNDLPTQPKTPYSQHHRHPTTTGVPHLPVQSYGAGHHVLREEIVEIESVPIPKAGGGRVTPQVICRVPEAVPPNVVEEVYYSSHRRPQTVLPPVEVEIITHPPCPPPPPAVLTSPAKFLEVHDVLDQPSLRPLITNPTVGRPLIHPNTSTAMLQQQQGVVGGIARYRTPSPSRSSSAAAGGTIATEAVSKRDISPLRVIQPHHYQPHHHYGTPVRSASDVSHNIAASQSPPQIEVEYRLIQEPKMDVEYRVVSGGIPKGLLWEGAVTRTTPSKEKTTDRMASTIPETTRSPSPRPMPTAATSTLKHPTTKPSGITPHKTATGDTTLDPLPHCNPPVPHVQQRIARNDFPTAARTGSGGEKRKEGIIQAPPGGGGGGSSTAPTAIHTTRVPAAHPPHEADDYHPPSIRNLGNATTMVGTPPSTQTPHYIHQHNPHTPSTGDEFSSFQTLQMTTTTLTSTLGGSPLSSPHGRPSGGSDDTEMVHLQNQYAQQYGDDMQHTETTLLPQTHQQHMLHQDSPRVTYLGKDGKPIVRKAGPAAPQQGNNNPMMFTPKQSNTVNNSGLVPAYMRATASSRSRDKLHAEENKNNDKKRKEEAQQRVVHLGKKPAAHNTVALASPPKPRRTEML